MKLLLVRHAKAEEYDPSKWSDDSERPLSVKGVQAFRRSGRVVGRTITPAVVLVSQYLRARQTAEILTDEADWPEPHETPEIADGEFFHLIQANFAKGTKSLALIGHEPSLTRLISTLVSGEVNTSIRMRPGAVALMKLSSAQTGELQWLLPTQVIAD